MKKEIAVVLLLSTALAFTGCESLPRKFVRKKAKPEHTPAVVYIEKGPYQKKYSNEYYYKTHYTMWKTWQDETLAHLNGNSKKLSRSIQEAYSNLESMSRYLNPEKQALLKPLLDELGALMDKLETSGYSRSQTTSMRTDLERIKRLVANDFYYDKVRSELLPDHVDLGAA